MRDPDEQYQAPTAPQTVPSTFDPTSTLPPEPNPFSQDTTSIPGLTQSPSTPEPEQQNFQFTPQQSTAVTFDPATDPLLQAAQQQTNQTAPTQTYDPSTDPSLQANQQPQQATPTQAYDPATDPALLAGSQPTTTPQPTYRPQTPQGPAPDISLPTAHAQTNAQAPTQATASPTPGPSASLEDLIKVNDHETRYDKAREWAAKEEGWSTDSSEDLYVFQITDSHGNWDAVKHVIEEAKQYQDDGKEVLIMFTGDYTPGDKHNDTAFRDTFYKNGEVDQIKNTQVKIAEYLITEKIATIEQIQAQGFDAFKEQIEDEDIKKLYDVPDGDFDRLKEKQFEAYEKIMQLLQDNNLERKAKLLYGNYDSNRLEEVFGEDIVELDKHEYNGLNISGFGGANSTGQHVAKPQTYIEDMVHDCAGFVPSGVRNTKQLLVATEGSIPGFEDMDEHIAYSDADFVEYAFHEEAKDIPTYDTVTQHEADIMAFHGNPLGEKPFFRQGVQHKALGDFGCLIARQTVTGKLGEKRIKGPKLALFGHEEGAYHARREGNTVMVSSGGLNGNKYAITKVSAKTGQVREVYLNSIIAGESMTMCTAKNTASGLEYRYAA